MSNHMHGSRRAILKASVALIAIGAGSGMIAACSNEAPAPAAAAVDPNPVVATTYGKVKGALEALACDGRLDLAKKLASMAAALSSVAHINPA
jgi:hypothetical protein